MDQLELSSFFTTKQWHYMSVATEQHYIALTAAQFNYIEDVYVSVASRKSGDIVFEYHWQMPLGRTLAISPASTQGCTSHRGWGSQISACFKDGRWDIAADFGSQFRASITVERGEEALVLLFPLNASQQRPAYVHKEAGMKARGSVALENEGYTFDQGAATIDWTKTIALRETKWQWVSASCAKCDVATTGRSEPEKKRIGINLSRLVYDVIKRKKQETPRVSSAENALWVDGNVFAINNAELDIKVPDEPSRDAWTISGTEPGRLDVQLQFKPNGVREDHTGAVAVGIVSDFVQPHGVFTGFVAVKQSNGDWVNATFDGAYGVCENHRAVW